MRTEYASPDIATESALRKSASTEQQFVAFQSVRELAGSTDASFSFGIRASRPAGGAAGDRYLATDIGTVGGWLYYWNGTSWEILAGWASGTNAARAAITVTAVDDGAWFYTTDTSKFWEVSAGAWVDRTPASGVADGDKGDITVSGSGATWTVDSDVITYAKMQNVSATDKLLGRSTAGAGDVEEIACTAAGRAILDDTNAAAQRTTLGLGSVDNTADTAKPVSTAQQTALDLKANKANETHTGTTQFDVTTEKLGATATYKKMGQIAASLTGTGNVGAGEDDLHSITILANTLGTALDTIDFFFAGITGANANNKRLRVYFGTNVLVDTGVGNWNNADWEIRGTIMRSSATVQRSIAAVRVNGVNAFVDSVTGNQTLTGDLTLKVTGEAVSNNDIVCNLSRVNWIPAP
jgi:hypothetical protein